MGDQHCRGGGEHGRKNHVNSAHWHSAQSSDIQLSTLGLVCNNACKRYMHKKQREALLTTKQTTARHNASQNRVDSWAQKLYPLHPRAQTEPQSEPLRAPHAGAAQAIEFVQDRGRPARSWWRRICVRILRRRGSRQWKRGQGRHGNSGSRRRLHLWLHFLAAPAAKAKG